MSARRTKREAAIRQLNEVAERFELDPIPVRSRVGVVEKLRADLCSSITADVVEQISQAREKYAAAGGQANLPTETLEKLTQAADESQADVDGFVPSHQPASQADRQTHRKAENHSPPPPITLSKARPHQR